MNLRFQDALTARRKQLAENDGQKGFTLIELLVVVIIIGILAAIAIPVFLNLREGAWRASVESDLKNSALAIEAFSIENNGSLADLAAVTDVAGLVGAGVDFSQTAGTQLVFAFSGNSYTITGTHDDLGTAALIYNSATGGLGDWAP